MLINKYLVVICLIIGLTSCKEKPKPNNTLQIGDKDIKEAFVKINSMYIDAEEIQIDKYAERRNWNLTRTKSGVRYLIYKKGTGSNPVSGTTVEIEYEISLISGEVVYSSKQLGDKIFEVGRSDEPTGLQEAIKLLKVGDRAKVIIPSYLAYGLLGDNKKIPVKSTLIYDIYLKKIKNAN